MTAPTFLKKLFANKAGEFFLLAIRNIPLLKRISIALMPRHTDYSADSFRSVSRNGIRYRLCLYDWLDWNLFFKNKIEPRHLLYELVKPGFTVVDAGANMGETTLNLALAAGAGGKIISFEPSPLNFKKLNENISLNPELISRISTFNMALGSKPGKTGIKIRDSHNSGMNMIDNSGMNIRMTTIDLFYSEHRVEACHLIKTDVEGYDLQVLKGAVTVINKHKPILFFESDNQLLSLHGDSAGAILQFLKEIDYRIVYPETQPGDFLTGHHDVIARPA